MSVLDALVPSINDTAKDLEAIIISRMLPNGVLRVTQTGNDSFLNPSVEGGTTASTTIDGYRVLTIATAIHSLDITVKRTSLYYIAMSRIFNQQQQFPWLNDANGSIWLNSLSIQQTQHGSGASFLNFKDGQALSAGKQIKESTSSWSLTSWDNASYGILKSSFDIIQELIQSPQTNFVEQVTQNTLDTRKRQISLAQQQALNAQVGKSISNLAIKSYEDIVSKGGNPSSKEDIMNSNLGKVKQSNTLKNAIIDNELKNVEIMSGTKIK